LKTERNRREGRLAVEDPSHGGTAPVPSPGRAAHIHGLAAQHKEILSAHHHKAHKLLAEDLFDLVGLLDGNADAQRVDRALEQNAFVLITADDDWGKQQFRVRPGAEGPVATN